MDDAATMTATPRPPLVSMAEFDEIFESVKNWGRWGPDDQRGTLNYITPQKVREAAGLVRSGRHVSMEIPDQRGRRPGQLEPGDPHGHPGPRHRHRLERSAVRS